jgi:hypothetical protein
MRALRPNTIARRLAAMTFTLTALSVPVLGSASAANAAVAHAAVAHVRAHVAPRAVAFAPLDVTAPDGIPDVTDTSISGNDVTVSWDLNGAASDGGVTVELIDANGTIVDQQIVDPSADSYTFSSVADGETYNAVVVATAGDNGTVSLDPSSDISVPATLETPEVTNVSSTLGAVSLTWTNVDVSASSVDVTLEDAQGNVLNTTSVDANVNSAVFDNVPDGQGYQVFVTAHTSNGDATSSPVTFDVTNGATSSNVTLESVSVAVDGPNATVSWTSSGDVANYDVIVYDAQGTVVQEENVDPSETSATFMLMTGRTTWRPWSPTPSRG